MPRPYPQMFRVRQSFEGPTVDDIPGTVEAQLARLRLAERIRPGQSVAITAGSRGIANIRQITKAIVDHLRRLEARPFVVPSMGSHGGGTADGQRAILASYGITEEHVGCPIRATMDTVVVGEAEEGFPIHFDRYAYEADHVVVCGRVKPHTGFIGDIESGLMKMMLIGLGKHAGATIYHRAIQDYSFGHIVRRVADRVIKNCRIAAGVAIVENGYDETALIEAVAPGDIETREKELLVLARRWMARLPFERVDVLIIDEMGKNISGTGIDSNIVGRKGDPSAANAPQVRRIVVRQLTEATHGNATGIGSVDFCTTRLVRQMDRQVTAINCITGNHPEAARVPIHYETDRELLDAALANIGLTEPVDARVLWIRNTLDLVEVECSAAYYGEARGRSDLRAVSELRELPLDAVGNLPPFASLATPGRQAAHSP
jgi:lactate racemase-like protein